MNDLLKYLAFIVFAVGGIVYIRLTLKQVMKDLNGQGKIVRDDRRADEFRALTSAMTTLVHTEDEKRRQWLVDKFLNGWRRP